MPSPTDADVNWMRTVARIFRTLQSLVAVHCRQWRILTGVLVVALVMLNGCGPHSDRRAVSGKVTLNGTPLDGGSIRLVSVGGQKQMASGAMINGGTYMIPQEKGLVPGKYHLEIYAPDNKSKPVFVKTSPDGQGVMTQPERIPAEYNVESTKVVDVTADGNNQFNFEIVTKPGK